LITNFEMTNVAKSGFIPFKSHCDWGFQSIDLKEWFSANSILPISLLG
jgi:hypothetical protein